MLYFLIIVTAINLFYWIILFGKFPFYVQTPNQHKDEIPRFNPAVIIASRNELENLKANLPTILEQECTKFRIVLVDDGSVDGTKEFLERLASNHVNLKVISFESHQGKKVVLNKVLPKVENEIYLFTDADCKSNSPFWIDRMLEGFYSGKDIVLGYAPLNRTSGLLNKFARFETFMTALQYFSYALRGIPYMGVGRNLAYRKSLFVQQQGFDSHINTLSGDDDLFVNQAGNASNIYCQIHPDSFMYSDAPMDLKNFLRQKRRHISSSFSYKLKHQFLLSLYALTQILFYLFLFTVKWQVALSVYFARFILIMIFHKQSFKKLAVEDLYKYFLFLDPLISIYYIFMSVMTFNKRKIKWKDQ